MVTHAWRRLCCVFAAALLLAPAARADLLIDFEGLTPNIYGPTETFAVGDYEFVIDMLGIGVVDTAEAFFFGGAPTNATGQFLAILNGGAVGLYEADLDPFSLESFAFAFISPFAGAGFPGTAVGQITVAAIDVNNNPILQSFEFPAADGDGNFSFATAGASLLDPGFGGMLLGVGFVACLYDDTGACITGDNLAQFAVDNIVISATSVPEPGTLSLLLLALAGFVVARRRAR